MAYIQLASGAYQTRSIISAAQRCLNLYPETAPTKTAAGAAFGDVGEAFRYVHNSTPGLTLLSTAPQQTIRGLYTASNGYLFAVAGQNLYLIGTDWKWLDLGQLKPSSVTDSTPRHTPVSMVDNGLQLLVADGSVDGWWIPLPACFPLTRIDYTTDPHLGWYGATRVDYSDTYFLAGPPSKAAAGQPATGSGIFYISGSESGASGDITWDRLDYASKVAKADPLVSLIVFHRIIMLIGTQSAELWSNTGGQGSGTGLPTTGVPLSSNTFPFEAIPAGFFPYGLAAAYSLATIDNMVFFLSRDTTGRGVVMRVNGYVFDRISTYAIENQIAKYTTISTAIGTTYKQGGHSFYVLSFPQNPDLTGDATWVYDLTTGQWHERCWLDTNGQEHRHRVNFMTSAYDVVVGGDWETGNLYKIDQDNHTDAGMPIKRLRSFPHQIDADANRRVFYRQLVANMQVGTSLGVPNVIVNTSFDANDGTLLQNYTGGDVGAVFTPIDLGAQGVVYNDAWIGDGQGTTEYSCSGIPTTPNYTVTYTVQPFDYGGQPPPGNKLYVIGRADPSNNGYMLSITTGPTDYFITLDTMGHASWTAGVPALTSGVYTLALIMQGSSIAASVQRSVDNMWLTGADTWSTQPALVFSTLDTHYQLPGKILVGGQFF